IHFSRAENFSRPFLPERFQMNSLVRLGFHGVVVTLAQPDEKKLGFLNWKRDTFLQTGDLEKGSKAIIELIMATLHSVECTENGETKCINYASMPDKEEQIRKLLFLAGPEL